MEHHESSPSLPSTSPTTRHLDALLRLISTIKRQHTITITKLTRLEEKLPSMPAEEETTVRSVWSYFWPFSFEERDHRDAG